MMRAIKPRDMEILKARQTGETLRAIAGRFGLSWERVRQICVITERKLKNGSPLCFGELPVRIHNAILNATRSRDLTPEEIAQLSPDWLLEQPNFGRKSLDELRKWLAEFGLSMREPEGDTPKPETLERYAATLRKYGWAVNPPAAKH